MSTHTPAEQACFDELVEHNKPMDRDGGETYPSCLWPIAEAATKAVLDATEVKACTGCKYLDDTLKAAILARGSELVDDTQEDDQ